MVADAGIEPTSFQRMKLVSSTRTLIRYSTYTILKHTSLISFRIEYYNDVL